MSKNSFALRSNSTTHQYRVVVDKFLVNLARVRVSPSVAAKIEEQLQKGPALYPIRFSKARIFTITAGLKYFETELFGSGASVIPNTLILGVTTTRATNGTYGLSPYRFQHWSISSLVITVNGESRPSPNGYTNLVWTGNGQNWMRCYFDLFDSTIKVNEGNSINMSEYKDNYCLFKINLGYFHTESHDHIEPKKISSARLTITFAPDSANESLSLVSYTEIDQVLALNSKREVIRDFVL